MSTRVTHGTVVFRRWKQPGGLIEMEQEFSSLDELFSLCLRSGDPKVVNRIVLRGPDERGTEHTLTFAFESIRTTEM
jgi:hypothetical protein